MARAAESKTVVEPVQFLSCKRSDVFCIDIVGVLIPMRDAGSALSQDHDGDLVRVKRANLLFAEYGDHIGRVLRERPEIKMGSVERVDATFPGKRDLIGVEKAVLEFAALRWDFRRAPSGPIWRGNGEQAGYVKDGAIYDVNNERSICSAISISSI